MPPLQRNIKTDRGFYHPRTGELLCPVDLDWNDPKYGYSSELQGKLPLTFGSRIQDSLRSGEIVPAGDQWPRFLYQNNYYNEKDPWDGLLRGELLVLVSLLQFAGSLPPIYWTITLGL